MATYYVSGSGNDSSGNGSSGNPWRSLGKANQQAGAGDTVIVRNGTYEEQLSISKANMTWRADTGHTPVVNGRWHIGLMSGGNVLTKSSTMPKINAGSYLPPGTNSKQGLIQITAAGVTVDGFVVQNSTGSGISIGASNCTVKNCVTYFTYSSGILSNPGSKVTGISILNNVIRFASMKIFDPARFTGYAGSCPSQCVDGSLKVGNNNGNTLIQGNDVAFGFGEGINIGKYNDATAANPIIVEGNKVHDINHTYVYVNASTNVIIRNNLLYCTGVELNMWDGDPPAGIRIKDEKEDAYVQNVTIYNNVIVNSGVGFYWGERHTAARGVYFGHNTIVGGPEAEVKNKFGIMVIAQQTGSKAPQVGIIENNVVDHTAISTAVLKVANPLGNNGVTLRNNNWSRQPSPNGAADVVANPKLVNAGANLTTTNYPTKANTTWASVTTADNLNINNYKLTSSSPGRGAASNGSAASGVTPPAATNKDYYGNNRDAAAADRDLGAIEFGGSAPPADDIHANFTFSPASGGVPLAVNFTDTSTVEGAAAANTWLWNFGDGGTATTQNPSHNYATAGVYTVTLTVSDAGLGISDSIAKGPVTVTSEPDPTVSASFEALGPTEGLPPLSVSFADLSGGPVTTWLWDFGDGGTATTQNPTHVYEQEGNFDVTLTVTDGGSASDTTTVVEFVIVTLPARKRGIIGPFPAVDVETADGLSVTHHDISDDANTISAGLLEIATNRPRPIVRLVQQEAEPAELPDELEVWFDEDGTMKAKLPNGTVKTFTWT